MSPFASEQGYQDFLNYWYSRPWIVRAYWTVHNWYYDLFLIVFGRYPNER